MPSVVNCIPSTTSIITTIGAAMTALAAGCAGRGSGQARWIRPTLAVLFLIVAGAGIFLALRERSQPSAAAPSPRAAAPTARVSATTAAHTPIFPTITPSPPHPILHVGGTA